MSYVTATVTELYFIGAAMLFYSCFFSRNIKLHGLPLSAVTASLDYLPKMSAFNSHMRQNAFNGNMLLLRNEDGQ